jgi:hypothetical protein
MFAMMGVWGEALSRIGMFQLKLQPRLQVRLHPQVWLCLQLLPRWILFQNLRFGPTLNHLLQSM